MRQASNMKDVETARYCQASDQQQPTNTTQSRFS
jgi:hypothetical protein